MRFNHSLKLCRLLVALLVIECSGPSCVAALCVL